MFLPPIPEVIQHDVDRTNLETFFTRRSSLTQSFVKEEPDRKPLSPITHSRKIMSDNHFSVTKQFSKPKAWVKRVQRQSKFTDITFTFKGLQEGVSYLARVEAKVDGLLWAFPQEWKFIGEVDGVDQVDEPQRKLIFNGSRLVVRVFGMGFFNLHLTQRNSDKIVQSFQFAVISSRTLTFSLNLLAALLIAKDNLQLILLVKKVKRRSTRHPRIIVISKSGLSNFHPDGYRSHFTLWDEIVDISLMCEQIHIKLNTGVELFYEADYADLAVILFRNFHPRLY